MQFKIALHLQRRTHGNGTIGIRTNDQGKESRRERELNDFYSFSKQSGNLKGDFLKMIFTKTELFPSL